MVLQTVRFHEKHRRDIESADFWRALNPELNITPQPFAKSLPPCEVKDATIERSLEQLRKEGYFQIPPLVPQPELHRFAQGIERVVAQGFSSGFACVYDEFYQLFSGLGRVLRAVLGEDYLMVPYRFFTFFIDTQDTEMGLGPHRDSLNPDSHLLKTGMPSLLTLWIPLTDSTPTNSCLYGVPAQHDPCYLNRPAPKSGHFCTDHTNLQDARALPANAGSLLGWTSHFLHWGGRSSQWAQTPRLSVAMYFQRSDVPHFHDPALEMESEISFEDRLNWISQTIRDPKIFDYPTKNA